MRPPRPVTAVTIGVLLSALAGAACSGSQSDATGDATGITRATVPVVDTAADPIVSTAGTMGDTMGGAAADGFCGLVTTDDLTDLFGDATPGELTSDEGPTCTWPVGDGSIVWLVETTSFDALLTAAGAAADDVADVGDRAFFDGTTLVTEAGDAVSAVRYTPGRAGTSDAAVVQTVLTRIAVRLTTASFG